MMKTFHWKVDPDMGVDSEPQVSVVRFGDGYEQRQVKGINPLMDKYSLTFRGVSGACRSNPAKD
ncbi:phage tail protein, partial [Salmonella enterica subsp. enterica serovar Derby]|nr:phage tail protein [Salmonella enterica subsp. enterica serovar Derby]